MESPGKPAPRKTSVGAIAGGVVGGVVSLALIAGYLFYRHRRRAHVRKAAEAESDEVPRSRDSDEKKSRFAHEDPKFELQGVNENNPAELPGPEAVELNAPREFVEADHDTAAWASELPGTNTAPGGVHGVPILRTPGDDLPESPEYTPGLRRPASAGSRRGRRRSSISSERVRASSQPRTVPQPREAAQREDYFSASSGPSNVVESPKSGDVFRTPAEQVSPPEPERAIPVSKPSKPPTPPSPPTPPVPVLPGTAV